MEHDDNDTFACPKRCNLRLNLRLTRLQGSFVFRSVHSFGPFKTNKSKASLPGSLYPLKSFH